MEELSTPLDEVRGISPRFLSKLAHLGLHTVRDLLWHFPTRYEDFSKIYPIAELIPNQEATVQAIVEKIKGRPSWHRNLFLVEGVLRDETGSIRATWFNQPYIRNTLQPGRLANFSGKVVASRKDGELYLSNPSYELVRNDFGETTHTGRIVPIYPETRGLTSRGLRFLLKPLLDGALDFADPLPRDVLEEEGFPDLPTALRDVHFPETLERALAAKGRFAFEDLFLLQLLNLRERMALAKEHAPAIPLDAKELNTLVTRLPFELTASQEHALQEILRDLARPHPMNRLLQGDVGSGKTILAALAARAVARAGWQTAFMAPTEILARQHYRTLTRLFPEFENGIALLTSSEVRAHYGHDLESVPSKSSLGTAIERGKIAIAIGTHALIQKTVRFARLGFVVVDEQHRFGVRQRDTLLHHASARPGTGSHSHPLPHFLSMSATPIPRTLSLTLFGDLDVSLITELPKNRKPIITKAVASENRPKAYAFIRGQIHQGRQAFVICPRIESSGNLEATEADLRKLEWKSVEEEYEKLKTKIFPDLRVAMLHGRMKPAEKAKIMHEFAAGAHDILVATSVVEVGVDIPNAAIMMIEGAERFGLAQLYQFRGRVGRGAHQSFCFLFSDSPTPETHARLKAIVEARNGFELAEQDLRLRGPGEFLGEMQTGMPDLAMIALQNPAVVRRARAAAERVLAKDPTLARHPLLQDRLAAAASRIHRE